MVQILTGRQQSLCQGNSFNWIKLYNGLHSCLLQCHSLIGRSCLQRFSIDVACLHYEMAPSSCNKLSRLQCSAFLWWEFRTTFHCWLCARMHLLLDREPKFVYPYSFTVQCPDPVFNVYIINVIHLFLSLFFRC